MKNSVLNTEVSIFPDYDSPDNCEPVNLLTFLNSAKYRPQVEAIRATDSKAERNRLKAGLPCITPSGTFSRREEGALLKHSGLIQVDIDGNDNQRIGNFAQLKREVCKLPEIAYFGLSVSGRGYWGLIPIAYPHRHKEHFRALQQDFLKWGIRIDPKPANVASLRGYSYDPEPYFNHQAKPYRKLLKPRPKRTAYQGQYSTTAAGSEAEKVEACLQLIEAGRKDITGRYYDWFPIACALANEFGEGGRGYFHRASQYHPEYNPEEADRQYSACLRKRYSYTLATFYQICRQHGISYREALPTGQAQAKPVKAPQQPETAPTDILAPEASEKAPEQATEAPDQAPMGEIPSCFTFYPKPGTEGQQGLEYIGLPFPWLNDTERAEAAELMRGIELEIMQRMNPALGQLIERFELIPE